MGLKKTFKHKHSIFIVTGIIGFILIVLGVVFLYWERGVLSFSTNPYASVNNEFIFDLLPKKISIESVGVNLIVEEGEIVDGVWQISADNATHLINSEVPGRKGNIVIYGHNKKSIFGKLVNVKKGDVIEILTKNGKIYKYKVSDILEVDPTNIGVVNPTDYEVLTIYTCIGFLDSKRLVVKALPLS